MRPNIGNYAARFLIMRFSVPIMRTIFKNYAAIMRWSICHIILQHTSFF